MKKNLLFTCLMVLSMTVAFSQAPAFAWVKSSASLVNPDINTFSGVAVDTINNVVYATGSVGGGGINFGAGDLQTSSELCVYLVKYNLSGNLIWAKAFYSNGDNTATGVGVDNAGNVYVTGYSQSDSVIFGGQFLFNSHPGSTDHTVGYVVKFDSGGNAQWIRGSADGGGVVCNAIAVDAAGNSYITGHVFDASGTFMGNATTQSGFYAKISASGSLTWFQQTAPTGALISQGTSIALDNAGNLAICGTYAASINFGSVALAYNGSSGTYRRFIAKMSASTGVCAWANTDTDGSGLSYPYDVATDLQNNIYVTGNRPNNGAQAQFVEKLNPSGTSAWVNSYSTSNLSPVTSVVTDKHGDVFATFNVNATTVYGNFTVSAIGSNFPIILAIVKLDGAGNVLYTKSSTNPVALSWSPGSSIAVDEGGDLFISGTISNECKFDNIDLQPESNHTEFALAKLGNNVTGGGSTGIHTQIAGSTLSVYPNPASNTLYISGLTEKSAISITDLSGKHVLSTQTSAGNNLVDVSSLPAGMYVIEIDSNGTKAHQKIIISAN